MNQRRDLLQESLAAIESLEARLAASESARHEPIAIIGAGCRYAGGVDSPEALWRVFREGVDAVREVPAERWDADAYYDPDPKVPGKMITKWGGFLPQVDLFDARFFGISPREAATMDPQQRLLLEAAHEALESAGCAPDRLVGSRTGVFVGITTSDYGQRMRLGGSESSDVYSATGTALNAAAGRISFVFGFQGPCVAIDTACSSSLVAVHLACQSLRTGDSDLALAGGVNLVLAPELMVLFSKWGMMAPDGRCKTFDAKADGFVRSEGCAVIALKRLSNAIADKDPVLAVIRGSAVNSDGRSSGLTVPNGPAQEAVIRTALKNARLTPADIDYVEAHGTGTSLGDPIEVEALGAVMAAGRPADRPLLIGAAKTNLGHTEAAAGLAGLLKVVMSLRHEAIAPNLHFSRPSPAIPWGSLPIEVPTSVTPWPRGARPRRAGVSAFGFSGTNAHAILEEFPVAPAESKAASESASKPASESASEPAHESSRDRPYVLPLSARTDAALRALAGSWAARLAESPQPALADVCYTAAAGRAHYPARLAVRATSVQGARAALSDWLEKGQAEDLVAGEHRAGAGPRIAFLFTGQGSQYAGMGRALYRSERVFREALDRCAAAMSAHLSKPLLDVMFASQEESADIHLTGFTQPALFALEYALAELWKSWGVTPHVVLGHSVGEYAAACVAGVMSLEEGASLIATRGKLMQSLPAGGAMAAVFATHERIAPELAAASGWVSIAALNSPEQVVLSGRRAELDAVLRRLAAAGIESQPLVVSHAFHSALLDPMLDELEAAARRVAFRAPHIPIISNLTGSAGTAETFNAHYWRRHAREPVLFAASARAALALGCDTFLEIGPAPTLTQMVDRLRPESTVALVPSLRRSADEAGEMTRALGALYVRGARIAWTNLEWPTHARRISLPTYPFQRERHWVEVSRQQVSRDPTRHPLLGTPVVEGGGAGVRVWEGAIDLASLPYLVDHRVQGRIIVPATAYLEMVVAAGIEAFGAQTITLSAIKIHAPIALDDDTRVRTQTLLTSNGDGTHDFAVQSRAQGASSWTLLATGRLSLGESEEQVPADATAIRARCEERVDGAEFYRLLAARGNDWGPCFRGLARVWRGTDEALAEVQPAAQLSDLQRYHLHPALADSSGHVLAATIPLEASPDQLGGAFVGGGIDRFVFRRSPRGRLWSHARRRRASAPNVLAGDIRLVDEDGTVVTEVAGVQLWYLDSDAERRAEEMLGRRLYTIEWRSQPFAAAGAPTSVTPQWLIFADTAGIAAAARDFLKESGAARCVMVEPGEQYARLGGGRYKVRPGNSEDMRRLIDETLDADQVTGIAHLWNLDNRSDETTTVADLGRARELGCTSVFALVQGLAQSGRRGRTRLWLVTQGAQAAGPQAQPVAVAAGAVWGLGRSLAVEHADLWGGLIDLDPAGETATNARSLVAQMLRADAEDQVAFRGNERFAARLVRMAMPRAAAPMRWRVDASYLITGGLGGLGLRVAHWMVEQGARRLILLGRSGLPPRNQWHMLDAGSRDGRRVAAIRELEAMGAAVHVVQVDVADESALGEFLRSFRAEGWPRIRGVVHAAGTLQYGAIAQTTPAQIADLLRPKLDAGWLLHRLLAAEPLDFFVLFSSASGVLNSPMVAAYAAANAALDSLAHHRAALGLPALSIDWGLWSGAGMAEAADADTLATLTARGMGSLTPEQALEGLAVLLSSRVSQAGVIPVHWRSWRERYPMFSGSPFLAEILETTAGTSDAPRSGASSLQELLALAPAERMKEVTSRLRTHAGAVLRLDAAAIDVLEPLTALGIDSLMAVEFRNRVDRDLGLSAPLVHYLDGSGIARLAEVLLEPHAATPAAANDEALLARLPGMSEAEMDALLNEMLADEAKT
jgi:myxalamid-type polyketide synthase MxaE and MxaD